MTRYVLDPPTLLEVVARIESRGVEISTEHQKLVAPGTIRSEALALLFAAVQGGELTEEVALDRHERLTGLKMRLLNDRVPRRLENGSGTRMVINARCRVPSHHEAPGRRSRHSRPDAR